MSGGGDIGPGVERVNPPPVSQPSGPRDPKPGGPGGGGGGFGGKHFAYVMRIIGPLPTHEVTGLERPDCDPAPDGKAFDWESLRKAVAVPLFAVGAIGLVVTVGPVIIPIIGGLILTHPRETEEAVEEVEKELRPAA